jgi:small GTP-binding protein
VRWHLTDGIIRRKPSEFAAAARGENSLVANSAMGASQSQNTQNVLLLGLDGAGKTSVVARLIGDEVRTVLPTLGFSVRTFELGTSRHQLKLWDIGGRASVRQYWPAYYAKAHAIAFVIDTTDRRRLEENSRVLQHLLDDDQLLGLPLLVLANKQDADDAIPASEIEELMRLGAIRDRVWNCTACSALRGTGVVDGLHWLQEVHAQIHGRERGARASLRPMKSSSSLKVLSVGKSRRKLDDEAENDPIVKREPSGAERRDRRRNPIPTAALATEDAGSDDES